MKRIATKLRSQKGETLVELLASILIATLSVGLLLGGVAVSAKINRQGEHVDKKFYEALTKAESRQTPAAHGVDANPSVQVKERGETVNIPVQVYGEEGLYAYALKPSAGGGTP